MMFMVIEKFRNRDAKAVYRRLRDCGRQMPEGLTIVNSWVTVDLTRCFQVVECEHVALLQQWVAAWSDWSSLRSFQSSRKRNSGSVGTAIKNS
jgi:hypothetical protein